MTFALRSTSIATALLASGIALAAPAAHADQIDDALNALPAGQISCEQASRYWTNVDDYNSKVAQANAFAMFDRRGAQIREALGRVDEAANRCGLKGGAAPAGDAPAQAPAGDQGPVDGGYAPAPAGPAEPAGPAGPAPIMSSAPGLPSFPVMLPNGQQLIVPNLQQIVLDFLAQYGIRL